MEFINCFLFLCVIFALLDPDPYSGSGALIESGSGTLRIRTDIFVMKDAGRQILLSRSILPLLKGCRKLVWLLFAFFFFPRSLLALA